MHQGASISESKITEALGFERISSKRKEKEISDLVRFQMRAALQWTMAVALSLHQHFMYFLYATYSMALAITRVWQSWSVP